MANRYSSLFTYGDFLNGRQIPTNPPPYKIGSSTKYGSGKYPLYVGKSPLKQTGIGTPQSSRETVLSFNTNTTPSSTMLQAGGNIAVGVLGGIAPQLGQSGGSILSLATEPIKQFSTTAFDQLQSIPGLPYLDHRARRGTNIRLDGASAALRGSTKAALYAGASAAIGGAYTIFNLEATYGWGSQGDPNALRKDFTANSQVATIWDFTSKGWIPTRDPFARVTPFRGDKVNVVDFGKRTFKKIYQWKPERNISVNLLNDIANLNNTTKDFVKFYFTGPELFNGAPDDAVDDVLVFRATFSSLYDSFNTQWNPQQMIGRGDKNYNFGSYERNMNLDFTVVATDRDEMKPNWRKLNYLASFATPTYDLSTMALKGSWLRMTIGDILVQQPIILQNINYTLVDAETTWETNIVEDPTMMEAPHKIVVSLGFIVVTDFLPQRGGNMYSLAKTYDDEGRPLSGNDNWLSDSESTKEHIEKKKAAQDKIRKRFNKKLDRDSKREERDIQKMDKQSEKGLPQFGPDGIISKM